MKHAVRAKKSLGQHFLNDENIALNIVQESLRVSQQEPLIEIGPGTGILTKHLIARPDFLAVDVDKESVAHLKKVFPQFSDKILEADFLEIDLLDVFKEMPLHIVGNFPYNISSQILFKALENRNRVRSLTGMFQKEVAERVAEKPGTKTYGILSVLLQAFYDIKYLFTVNEHVFTPPPKVKSAVIQLKRNNVQQLGADEKLFIQVVKTTFNQRRKTIRNSIKPLGINFAGKEHPYFDKRPEQLGVSQFVELTSFLEAYKDL